MQKKASTKGGTKKRKAGRKLSDLPLRTGKGGDRDAVKGGDSSSPKRGFVN